MNPNDVGPDKIYVSEFIDGEWSLPELSISKEGYHINDPTVVAPPSSNEVDRSQWLYLYYTALSDEDAAEGRWNRHGVGFASSTDSGRSWTDHGIIIDQENGMDNAGAWSPSAIVREGKIWVYFHGNRMSDPDESLQGYMTIIEPNGWEQLETVKLEFHHREECIYGGTAYRYLCPRTYNVDELPKVNIDVSELGEQLVLLANDPSLHLVVRFVSEDGVNWIRHPGDVNPIIDGGPNLAITPHAEPMGPFTYNLYFAYDSTKDTYINYGDDFGSIHAWEFLTPLAGSDIADGTTRSWVLELP